MKFKVTIITDKEHEVAKFTSEGDMFLYVRAMKKFYERKEVYKCYKSNKLIYTSYSD